MDTKEVVRFFMLMPSKGWHDLCRELPIIKETYFCESYGRFYAVRLEAGKVAKLIDVLTTDRELSYEEKPILEEVRRFLENNPA